MREILFPSGHSPRISCFILQPYSTYSHIFHSEVWGTYQHNRPICAATWCIGKLSTHHCQGCLTISLQGCQVWDLGLLLISPFLAFSGQCYIPPAYTCPMLVHYQNGWTLWMTPHLSIRILSFPFCSKVHPPFSERGSRKVIAHYHSLPKCSATPKILWQ